jgi:citrate synthase
MRYLADASILIYRINMEGWIDRERALELLGVKPQTLYAYVSRGRVRMEPDPADSRRSLYSAEDISQIVTRRSRGRKPEAIAESSMSWGEPAIVTGISTVHRGHLLYRGHNAIDLARSASLEEVAALLWESAETPLFETAPTKQEQVFTALADAVADAIPMLVSDRKTLRQEATAIVGRIASVCGAASGEDPIHLRLARGWGCCPKTGDKLRQALVAVADHDLNASTFATRVTASTGASLPASILAGLCALSGPRHGGAFAMLNALVEDARRIGCDVAIDNWLDRGARPLGFGHPLYPGGDPRAALLLEGLQLDALLSEFRDTMVAKTGLLPNCDFALVAMVGALGLPKDAPFHLFLIGRSVGWCAHAMEQNLNGNLIRPRGRYRGTLPV